MKKIHNKKDSQLFYLQNDQVSNSNGYQKLALVPSKLLNDNF